MLALTVNLPIYWLVALVEKDFNCGQSPDHSPGSECYENRERLGEMLAPYIDFEMTDPLKVYKLGNVK